MLPNDVMQLSVILDCPDLFPWHSRHHMHHRVLRQTQHKLQIVYNQHCLHMTLAGEAHRTQPAESCRSVTEWNSLCMTTGLRAHLHKHGFHNSRLRMAGKQTHAVQREFYR